ncbi:Fimbral chaperone protein [Pseudomonas syringae pv. philadelphi]|uniref:Fimbral chaperone protein n=1 Tax=Pseudomonas syringae pv. philadelphi TaxID=251706 RepID=A0A3M3YJ33_9PSED|nr:molecular chaperone [Pseudomonas syringae group genomosp. 3]RMO82029.1 Fimbral chaperone protein [Pseudomonas syringae pv. philadelphi]
MSVVTGWRLTLLALPLTVSVSVEGAVALTGTRLIFDGQYREVSIEVRNAGKAETLVQAWLSDAHDSDDTPLDQRRSLPFVVTPPLSRLARDGRQALRILYHGAGMAQDRESLMHLYVLEVPRREEGHRQLNIAVRQRINVFYRPQGLAGDPAETASQLQWRVVQAAPKAGVLKINNPTPYYASLEALRLDGVPLERYLLLAPGGEVELTLPGRISSFRQHRLLYNALTDYGGRRAYCARMNGQGGVMARLLENTSFQEEC